MFIIAWLVVAALLLQKRYPHVRKVYVIGDHGIEDELGIVAHHSFLRTHETSCCCNIDAHHIKWIGGTKQVNSYLQVD
jgi:hypothetical protein